MQNGVTRTRGGETICGCSSGRELSGKPGICHQNIKAGQETCYPLKSELKKKKDFHRGPKPISEMWIQIIKKRAFTVTSAGLISCVISLPQWSWALSLLSETSPGETGFQLPCTKRKKEQARQRGKSTRHCLWEVVRTEECLKDFGGPLGPRTSERKNQEGRMT